MLNLFGNAATCIHTKCCFMMNDDDLILHSLLLSLHTLALSLHICAVIAPYFRHCVA